MNCKRFEEKLSAYIDGELDFESRNQIEKHLLECRECAQTLDDMRRIESFKPLLEPPSVPEEKWQQCWDNIRKETTDSLSVDKVKESIARRRKPVYLQRIAFGLAGAVAAILVAAIIFWPSATEQPPPATPAMDSVCVLDYDDSNYNLYVIDKPEYTIIKLIPVNTQEGG